MRPATPHGLLLRPSFWFRAWLDELVSRFYFYDGDEHCFLGSDGARSNFASYTFCISIKFKVQTFIVLLRHLSLCKLVY